LIVAPEIPAKYVIFLIFQGLAQAVACGGASLHRLLTRHKSLPG